MTFLDDTVRPVIAPTEHQRSTNERRLILV